MYFASYEHTCNYTGYNGSCMQRYISAQQLLLCVVETKTLCLQLSRYAKKVFILLCDGSLYM